MQGFRECYQDVDNLDSVSKSGIWGRLLAYIGKPCTRVAILVLKRWCLKNDILEGYFLNINDRRERENVSENTSKSSNKGGKSCPNSISSEKKYLNNDGVNIPFISSPPRDSKHKKDLRPSKTATNPSTDANTKSVHLDENHNYTLSVDSSDGSGSEIFENLNNLSSPQRIDTKKANDHQVSKETLQMDTCIQALKSEPLIEVENFQLNKEKKKPIKPTDCKDNGGIELNVDKNAPYNLRPSRSVQSNKRYFNDAFDCSTKRKKAKSNNKYRKMSPPRIATNDCKTNSDKYSLGMEDDYFVESDHSVEKENQTSAHPNNDDSHLSNVTLTQSTKETSASNDLEHIPINQNTIFVHNNENQNIFPKRDKTTLSHETELEKETSELDTSQNILNQENSFSEETFEATIGASPLEPYFQKTIPNSGEFNISEKQWIELKSSQKGRCFSNSNWENIICDGVKDANPFCVYMFKWHKVSVASERMSTAKPLFRGEGICKFPDCKNVLKFSMDTKRKVKYTMSDVVKHDIQHNFSRPFRGEKRQQLQKMFEDGPKPFKHYMDKFSSVSNEVKLAGNFSEFGNSPQTFQKIASESRFSHTLDKSEFESLLKISDNMIKESNAKRLPGFIRHISIFPPIVMYWTETGVRIWHDMAKDSVVFWDATGSVISPRQDRPRFYYYELACLNPTKGQNIIPVTSLLSTLHSTPMIRFWLSEFRRAEKKLFGHANIAIPKQVNSDRSLVFIQAALSEFNNETMDDFKSRAWRIINGEASAVDMTKVNPHACLSHVMSSFKKVVNDVFKSNSEFGMFCFSLLVNSTTLNDIKDNLSAVYQVLLSNVLNHETEDALKKINKRLSKLSSKSSVDMDEENMDVSIQTDSIFPEFAEASRLTEEDYLNRSTTNAFYKMSEEILKNIKETISKTPCHGDKGNKFHSTVLVEKIHKLYMPTLPLWSDLLLGDLSRHGTSDVYQSYASGCKPIRGNTSIEKRFQVLKDITLKGKPVYRLDEFSVQLQTHVETLQNMAVIKSVKAGGKERKGRSTKTIEEEWDKKESKLSPKSFGKYQKPPSKDFSAIVVEKSNRKKTASTNVAKEIINKDTEQPPDVSTSSNSARSNTCSQSSGSVQRYQSLLYTHTCDHHISQLIRRKGCIAQRHLAFPNCLENITREEMYMLEKSFGFENIGNSCWFNAVLAALFPTDIMQIALDRFNRDMTFCPSLQTTLGITNNLHNEIEISNTDICDALNDLQGAFQIDARRQNDAHEFLTTLLSSLTGSLAYRNMRVMNFC